MSPTDKPRAAALNRGDFELECIREFSHSGAQLGASVSREERRERIRAAIWRENKQDQPWRNTSLTYAAAYELAYHQRLAARDSDAAPADPMALHWPRTPAAKRAPERDEVEEEDDVEALD